MKKCISLLFLTIASISSSIFAFDTNDHKTINQIVEHFTNTWNDHAGQGSADYYSQDADFVNIFGPAIGIIRQSMHR